MARVRDHLDHLVEEFHRPENLPQDPIGVVREYESDADREIVALLAALFAYGRVAAILDAVRTILGLLEQNPADALARSVHRRPRFASGFRYRWTSRSDLLGLLEAIARTRESEGSLGQALQTRVEAAGDFEAGLGQWIADLRERAASISKVGRGLRFLLPDPRGSGASKRLRLFLRWMIREEDGIDLGTWAAILPASQLTLPLDTHWARLGPRLGLTNRKTADARMAREITERLRELDPADPLRYDFTVCHIGIRGHCPPELESEHCCACPLQPICPTGAAAVEGTEPLG